MIEHALAAVKRGWYVYPLAAGTKVPPEGTDGPKSATNDPEVVAQWYEHGVKWGEGVSRKTDKIVDLVGNKNFNYGINTTLSGLVVIDIDVPKDPNYNPDLGEISTLFGGDAWCMLILNAGLEKQPRTYEVWSPSGGEHFYFKANENLPIRTATAKLAPGIDVRAVNGTIVGAGSVIRNKGTYELHRDLIPKPLPSWLRTYLGQAGLAVTDAEKRHKPTPATVRITDGDRYATGAFRSEIEQLRRTPVGAGQRNDALNTSAFKLRKFIEAGKLASGEVADALYIVATNDLGMKHNEVVATIKSGLGV